MAANAAPAKKTPHKPRVKKAVPYDAEAVAAAVAAELISDRQPFYRRAVFIAPALALALASIPFLRVGVNLLRPDRPAPAPATLDAAPGAALNARLADFAKRLATLRAAHPEFTDRIVRGLGYDPVLTPAFLDAVAEAGPIALTAAEADTPTDETPALDTLDGIELARLTHLRALQLDTATTTGIRAAHTARLTLAHCRLTSAQDPASFDAALDHTIAVLAEVREDYGRILPGLAEDPGLMRRLASASAPPVRAAAVIAARFDRKLDAAPDAALRLMTEPQDSGPLAADTVFEKLERFGRRKNAHREKITELHARFAKALAQPTFRESLAALAPSGHGVETRRLACMLLRDRALARLGDDHAIDYFYHRIPVAPREFDRFLLEFAALATADDAYGESLLLHRAAVLTKLVAKHQRVRFEHAATACAIAMEHRRALAGGKWPKSTEGLLDGLLDTYPADPFTGEPPAYSRKTLRFISPGADLVPRGGLDEPEFASDLMQLWEPTLAITPDPGPRPEAFGLRAADLEKPLPRPWEIAPKTGAAELAHPVNPAPVNGP